MQHKASIYIDRAAFENRGVGNAHVSIDTNMIEKIGNNEIMFRPIDDNPHRAGGIMRTEKDHGLAETRIAHSGCRDQILTRISLVWAIILNFNFNTRHPGHMGIIRRISRIAKCGYRGHLIDQR
jgi:hypothetical protein